MSGGGGFRGYSSGNIKAKISETSNNSQATQREIEVNEFLESLLKEFNNRDVEAIKTHLNEIEKALLKEIEGVEKILFGGSVLKNTFIEGTSDVDALVFLNSDKYKDVSPKKLQDIFVKLLKERFPRTEIVKGNLAVTIKFLDYEIQLLPALKANNKVKIANRTGADWSAPINTAAFTQKLTKVNQANSNKVVPVIKLVKNMFEKLPKEYKLSGYHVEALAVEAFTNYNDKYTLYDMTRHLLNYSVKRVLNPMHDVTGQSGMIDNCFGPSKSLNRQTLSHYIKDIEGRFSSMKSTSLVTELFT